MTPKEKAKELVDKYWSRYNLHIEIAKQCALIAVDEIIDAIIIIEDYDFETLIIFWQKVKQEIENHDTRTI